MAILAGIDEAGFGPTLGPLVVSGVAFRVPDDQLGANLWETLRASCAAGPERGGRRLPVADSKKLYRSRGGLAPLERTALVMLAGAGHRPAGWRALLDLIAPGATQHLDRCPWYADTDVSLPLSDAVGDTGTRANALRRDCAEHEVELVGVFSEPLLAGQYNRLVASTRNKAVVLLGLVLRVVDRVLRSASSRERVRLCIDRLGGRMHYREPLSTALPGYDLQILEESPDRSAYRLIRSPHLPPTGGCEIEFVTGGDARRFPVALASIYSKYLRELYMHVFNGFFCGKMSGLRPTAGYYTDARRWLKDIAPLLDRQAGSPGLSINRAMLIRSR